MEAIHTKPVTDAAIPINWAYPNSDHDDVMDLLYEVASEIRDSRLGHNLDAVHKRGGTLTDEMLFLTEYKLRDLADRVREVRDALEEVAG